MNIACRKHRLLPWLGHGVCLCCGKIYKQILAAPETCECGSRLLPRGKLIAEVLLRARDISLGGAPFSARPLCAKCAESASINGDKDGRQVFYNANLGNGHGEGSDGAVSGD